MMSYIVIDTEGTGKFIHRNEDGSIRPSDAPGQPRMAEFAAIFLDENFDSELEYQQYILPMGWMNADGSPMLAMPREAFDIHGLSMDFLVANGHPVTSALKVFTNAVLAHRIVIGFNQQHDGRQIRAELRHAGMPDLFDQTPNICAMRSLHAAKIKVQKLNGKGGFPRLIDAAAHFGISGYEIEKHHRALEDARATAIIAKHLYEMGKLLPAAVHYAKDPNEETST